MSAAPRISRPARLARHFPWMRLGRGPHLATDSRKLILAAVGLLLMRAGGRVADLAFARGSARPRPMFDAASFPLDSIEAAPALIAEPFLALIAPFGRLFALEPGVLPLVQALLLSIWTVLVWGLIGGAIARIAAVEGATGSRMAIWPALRFAIGHAIGLVGAPLSPLIGIGFFAALCVPLGLLYRIPGATGATIAGVLAFLPLMAGLVMALILAGLAAGWPLMVATVAVDAEDAFDALSRSYSYVLQRPGRYAAYLLLAGVLGLLGWMVVAALAALTIHMAAWGLSFGGTSAAVGRLYAGGPARTDASGMLHAFWLDLVRLLAHGWLYAYFFTAATLIYAALRREVDGDPLDDVRGLGPEVESFAGEPIRGEDVAK